MENINYWGAVGTAWNRMKIILFQPFSIEKWFLLGFAAWIAGLNSGGGGSGFNNSGGNSKGLGSGSELGSGFSNFWSQYGPLILMVGAIVIFIVLVLGIAFAWLHARGKFIFLDNVLHNRAAIVEPWKKYRTQGNSLFFWNLAIGAIGLFYLLLTAGLCLPMLLPMFSGHSATGLGLLGIALAITLLVIYTIVIAYVQMFVYDFVMPIMLQYDLRIREAWSRFHAMLKPAFGRFVIYGLVRFLLSILISIALMAAFLASCCCLLILASIPYIGTVLMLPIFVFIRLIGIEFLKQFDEHIGDVPEEPAEEQLVLP